VTLVMRRRQRWTSLMVSQPKFEEEGPIWTRTCFS
jgi:hypothetical protein